MKNVLNGNLKIWHLLAFGVAVMLFTGGAIAFADTDAISALWAPGTVRLGSSSATDTIEIPNNGTLVLVREVAVDVPAGKKADIQATFSGVFSQGGSDVPDYRYCWGQIRLDTVGGALFNPGEYQIMGGQEDEVLTNQTMTFTGFRKNVGQGTHKVQVYIKGSYNSCDVSTRNLNVIVNIR